MTRLAPYASYTKDEAAQVIFLSQTASKLGTHMRSIAAYTNHL